MKKTLAVDRWPLAETGGSPSANSQRPTAHEPRWGALYALVLTELALTIAVFYLFTKLFE